MKSKRHEKILELIKTNEIETQEELAALLNADGFCVTQATISRDIRELKLSKVNGHSGRQKYVAMNHGSSTVGDKYSRVLKEAFLSQSTASRIVVIRTVSGMAMAVAAALDAMDIDGFEGCIAGDDTIMCALCDETDEKNFMKKLDKITGRENH